MRQSPTLGTASALALAASLAAGIAGAAPLPAKEVHRTVPLSPSGGLEISTFKGSVAVTVWDRPEADIVARVEADGDDSEAARKVERTEIRIEPSGGAAASVRVESDYDRVRGLFSFFDNGTLPFVRYTIRMPATARLAIEDHKSDIRVSGLRADLRIQTYKGTVQVDRLDGAADVRTRKGEVHVAFARFSRPSRFETDKGSVDVRMPKDSRFDLDAEVGRRGEVDSDFSLVSRGRTGRRSGETLAGPVNGGGPTLSFSSARGSLRLKGE